MSTLQDFLPYVLPYVTACPQPAAEAAIRLALIEFCERSECWQVELDPISVIAGQATYELETPLDSQLLKVRQADYADRKEPLEEKSTDQLRNLYGDWRAREGEPRYFTQLVKTDIRLVPSPLESVADGLRCLVALRPTNDAREVDDNIFAWWAEPIGYGARARLKTNPGQQYYDPAAAAVDRNMFMRYVAEATLQTQRGQTRAPQTVQMRRW